MKKLIVLTLLILLNGCDNATTYDDTDTVTDCTPCEDGLDGFDGEPGAPGCVQRTYIGEFDETGSVLVDIGIDPASPPAMQAWYLAFGSDRWRQIPIELLTDGTLSFAGSADQSFKLLVMHCEIEILLLGNEYEE